MIIQGGDCIEYLFAVISTVICSIIKKNYLEVKCKH